MCFCPNCFELYEKKIGCDHMTCEQCKIHFCFKCCCLREPILVHGNHYHRKDC